MSLVNPLDMTTAETLLRVVLALALGAFVAGIGLLSLLGALVLDAEEDA